MLQGIWLWLKKRTRDLGSLAMQSWMLHGATLKVSWAIYCWVCVFLLSSCAHFIIVLLLSTDMEYLDWYKVEVTGKSSDNVCVSDPHISGLLPPVSYNSTFICRRCFHVYFFVFHQPYLALISQHPHTHTARFLLYPLLPPMNRHSFQ